MRTSKLTSFVAGAVVALVLGSGTAVAATGGKFILGKSNAETTTSKLTNPRGTALSLASKSGTAPLAVNSATKVTNLNSDRLDGLSSESFARTTGEAGSVSALGTPVDVDDDNVDDIVFAEATCPSGTQLTGGGIDDGTDTGILYTSAPDTDDPESWDAVVGIDNANESHKDQLAAYAVCYNPTGPVPTAAGFAAKRSAVQPSEAQLARYAAKVASSTR
jgi:hypothetical protein